LQVYREGRKKISKGKRFRQNIFLARMTQNNLSICVYCTAAGASACKSKVYGLVQIGAVFVQIR